MVGGIVLVSRTFYLQLKFMSIALRGEF
eukprot:SAG31_NODE_41166_length_277_cov_0.865169_1_plen_27_part_10